MAKFGLSYPVVAKLDVTTGTYSGEKVLSKACAVTVTPQYAESSLEADDDAEAEHLKDFTKADVSLEVSNLTAEDETLLFGHKVETDDIVYNGADQGSYVGLGYITRRRVDGKTTYQRMKTNPAVKTLLLSLISFQALHLLVKTDSGREHQRTHLTQRPRLRLG